MIYYSGHSTVDQVVGKWMNDYSGRSTIDLLSGQMGELLTIQVDRLLTRLSRNVGELRLFRWLDYCPGWLTNGRITIQVA